MPAPQTESHAARPIEQLAAILAAMACLLLTVAIWRSVRAHEDMWPLPGLYFVEVAGAGILAGLAEVRGAPNDASVTWAAAGILSAFSILGALSVGIFYAPIALILAGLSVSHDLRDQGPLAAHMGLFLIAGLAQAAIMFWLIRMLEPSAAF